MANNHTSKVLQFQKPQTAKGVHGHNKSVGNSSYMPNYKTASSKLPTDGTADRSHFNKQRQGAMLEIKQSHQRNQSDEIGQISNHSNIV